VMKKSPRLDLFIIAQSVRAACPRLLSLLCCATRTSHRSQTRRCPSRGTGAPLREDRVAGARCDGEGSLVSSSHQAPKCPVVGSSYFAIDLSHVWCSGDLHASKVL